MAKCSNCKKENVNEWYTFTFKSNYQTSGDNKIYCHDCLSTVKDKYKDHLAMIKNGGSDINFGMTYLCIWCEEEVTHEQWRVDDHNSKCDKRKQVLNQKPDNSRERERERERESRITQLKSEIQQLESITNRTVAQEQELQRKNEELANLEGQIKSESNRKKPINWTLWISLSIGIIIIFGLVFILFKEKKQD